MHGGMRNYYVTALTRCQIRFFAGTFPRVLHVSKVAEPLRGFITVKIQHSVNGLLLIICQLGRTTLVNLLGRNFKKPLMGVIKLSDYRAIGPSANLLLEDRSFIPDQRPNLGVIGQFLQLHDGHFSLSFKEISGYIKHSGHLGGPKFAARKLAAASVSSMLAPNNSLQARRP